MLLRKKYTKGFTLVEFIIVISIIGIMSAIAIPAYVGYVRKAKEEVCKANCQQVERAYEIFLALENIEHSDIVFGEFMKEYGKDLYPEHGVITYVEGKVECSEHSKDDDVPFL